MIHQLKYFGNRHERILSFVILRDKVGITLEIIPFGVGGFFAQKIFVPGQAHIVRGELVSKERAREIYKIYVKEFGYQLHQDKSLVQ